MSKYGMVIECICLLYYSNGVMCLWVHLYRSGCVDVPGFLCTCVCTIVYTNSICVFVCKLYLAKVRSLCVHGGVYA